MAFCTLPPIVKPTKNFSKLIFPRIPYPTSPKEFWDISSKGKQLRELHLMQEKAIGQTPFAFDGEGDNMVEKPEYKPETDESGFVFINDAYILFSFNVENILFPVESNSFIEFFRFFIDGLTKQAHSIW